MDNRWQVEVDGVSQAEWSQLLDLFSDANIYQAWSYGAVRWGSKNLSHIVIKRDGEPVAIAQVRIIRPTRFKFGMAYLRWGPICQRRGEPLEPEVVQRISQALEEEYVERRRLLLHVLPNAFAGSRRAELFQAAFGRFKPQQLTGTDAYRTFLVDLAAPLEELRKRLDKKWRNQLSRAERNNLKVVTGNGAAEFQTFSALYKEMRERKNFETNVDIDEFGRIQRDLPDSHRLRVLVCEDNGVPVAGLVASAMGDTAIYLLGATSDSGLNSKGAYLLQWTLIQELKAHDCRWYDLGGINPEKNPGVHHFKSGLSGIDTTQIDPMVACNSGFSSLIVNASLAVQRSVRRGLDTLRTAQSLKLARS